MSLSALAPAGQIATAINNLEAFVDQLADLIARGILTEIQG